MLRFRNRGIRWQTDATRPQRRKFKRTFISVALLGVCVLACGLQLVGWWKSEEITNDADTLDRRQLLASVACDRSSLHGWEKKGGVALYAIGVLYTFLGLAIVCDDFFVASLEAISEALSLSEDVAGATFMAAGSSAPELFSSIVSMANPNAAEALGVGTIVGSAVFNILMIIGATALFAGSTLYLDWKPLVRDAFFYCLAVISVVVVFLDKVVYWYEGLVFLCAYGTYVLFMVYNARIFEWMDSLVQSKTAVVPESVAKGKAPAGVDSDVDGLIATRAVDVRSLTC